MILDERLRRYAEWRALVATARRVEASADNDSHRAANAREAAAMAMAHQILALARVEPAELPAGENDNEVRP